MEIRNEVKTTDKDFEKKKFVVRNAADVQRAKLEKLMKNPEKPVIIPETPRERDFSSAIPTFVRNVMGSSAGAGSGEFHVYRHLRRKEYARQKHIQEKSRSEQLDDDFQRKLEQNKQDAEDRTSKKRAKRLKKKSKQKANRGKKPRKEESSDDNESDDEDVDEEDQNEVRKEGQIQEANSNVTDDTNAAYDGNAIGITNTEDKADVGTTNANTDTNNTNNSEKTIEPEENFAADVCGIDKKEEETENSQECKKIDKHENEN